jgi:hypothetical protein
MSKSSRIVRDNSVPENGAFRSLLPPSGRGFASLQGSLSTGREKGDQVSDVGRFIAVEAGSVRDESQFIP